MPTRRMIDPAFWRSESMAQLTEAQRLLFIGLVSNADDQGRLKAHPSLVRSDVYPYDDKPLDSIQADLAAIEAIGSILIYENGSRRYLQIVNWWSYQKPQWAYPSKIPAPPDWADRLRYRADKKVVTENWGDGSLPKALPKALPKDIPGGDGQGDRQGDGWPHSTSVSNSVKDSDSVSETKPATPAAQAPQSQPPPSEPKKPLPEKKLPLTIGCREFLRLFSAKRFANNAQREAVMALEHEHGTGKFTQAATWAAERGMSRGKAISAMRTALPKWGQPRASPGDGKHTGPHAGILEWMESKGVTLETL